MESIRIDKGTISGYRKDDGSLVANVRLSKVGVFPYLHSDGRVVREAKLPEELFKESTINSGNGAVVTDSHPDGLVNSSNYKDLMKGSVSNVKRDGIYLVGQEKIYDPELINKIANGEQVEVSIGFKQRTDWTSGVFDGQEYDCIQRDIEINHLAHVDQGRAGNDVRILLDSKQNYAIMQENNPMSNKKLTLRIDGKDFAVDKEVMDYIDSLKKTKLDADPVPVVAEPVVEPNITEPTEMPVDMNAISEKMKMADKIISDIKNKYGIDLPEIMSLLEAKDEMIELYKTKMTSAPADTAAAVADAINVIKTAEAILPGHKFDSYDPKAVKKEVIKSKFPTYKQGKLDGLTDSEIEIGFNAAVEIAKNLAVFGETKKAEIKADDGNRIDALKAQVEEARKNYYTRGNK